MTELKEGDILRRITPAPDDLGNYYYGAPGDLYRFLRVIPGNRITVRILIPKKGRRVSEFHSRRTNFEKVA